MKTRFLEGTRIFIIEDDFVSLSVFTVCLRESGAAVEQVKRNGLNYGNGIVTRIMECLPVDLIILDIMLRNGINGYAVYDAIRNIPQLNNTPVVVVTSLDPESEIPKAKTKGINGLIRMPIDMREFTWHIAKVLNGENVWVTDF